MGTGHCRAMSGCGGLVCWALILETRAFAVDREPGKHFG